MKSLVFGARKHRRPQPTGWSVQVRHLDGVARRLSHGLTRFQAQRIADTLNAGWLGEGGRAEVIEVMK